VRDAEIGQQRMIVREQNVLRLHIAVHEPIAVLVVETRANFVRNAKCVVDRELPVAIEPVAQRTTGQVRRDVIK